MENTEKGLDGSALVLTVIMHQQFVLIWSSGTFRSLFLLVFVFTSLRSSSPDALRLSSMQASLQLLTSAFRTPSLMTRFDYL